MYSLFSVSCRIFVLMCCKSFFFNLNFDLKNIKLIPKFFIVFFHQGSSFSINLDNLIENVDEIELQNENSKISNDGVIAAYSLLGKVQCKLCTEAMRPVVKELNKHSSKVNMTYMSYINIYLFGDDKRNNIGSSLFKMFYFRRR